MLKKLLLISILFLVTSTFVLAQDNRCASVDVAKKILAEDPEAANRKNEFESSFYSLLNQESSILDTTVTYIPVVVHVLYNTSAPVQNISDNQIYSQINALNADFRRNNTDQGLTHPSFVSIAADVKVEFRLAALDPTGAPTTGITRTATSNTSFGQDSTIFYSSLGGKDIWDRNCYLNIWVCKIGANATADVLGYAFGPGVGTVNKDGIVMDYRAFGSIGTAVSPYNKGRTCTHEVGHYLNLSHIWGDQSGCSTDDEVSDTPEQDVNTNNCPNGEVTDNCQTSSPGIMYGNYMDYTHDACMNIFTLGQKARIQASLLTPQRNQLKTCGKLGIITHPEANELKIFPNPSKGWLQVQGKNLQKNKLIEVYNALGEKISLTIHETNQNEFSLNGTQLSAGFYFLKIQSNESVLVSKFVIN